MWEVETIPDGDKLFYRIHKNYIREGIVKPKAFQERGESDSRGMSTDWEKYSEPQASLAQAKIPEDNGIVSFTAGNLRKISLDIMHAPLENNRAHTNVRGVDDVEKNLKVRSLFKWEILPPVELEKNDYNF